MITLKSGRRITAIAGSAALLAGVGLAGATGPVHAAATSAVVKSDKSDNQGSCHLGNGVKHVVQITFDNVHFFRDNPNVPSDLEQMPNLLNFFENNGTFLSNNHTPLIAHTADDILTTYTGLYGDRQGVPISNDYEVYQANGAGGTLGSTDNASSFAYWTDPVFDESPTATDTNPNMVYSPVPPATAKTPVTPDKVTPAPWVPFTRAGCNVGEIATANVDLENTALDIPKVFGVGSPEDQQLINDPDSFKDPETNDYVGIAVHCAKGSAFCAGATAVKYGQTAPSNTAVTDSLPDEPGGYNGYQALFGHRYVAPQLGAGTPNLSADGYQVTNAAGNLVDENGNELDGEFVHTPGFPGFDLNGSQALAYASDMLGSGVPVVNMYIADLHGNEFINGLSSKGEPCFHGDALGSGSACYIAQAAYYNQAFGTFFQRLAAMGMTTRNTMFILSSDEGDHEAGANVGRAIQPTPAVAGATSCDGVTVSGGTVTPDVACTYPDGSFGELDGNVTGLLSEETGDTTPFGMEFDTAPEYYINGDPSESSTVARQFDHDVAALTAFNPYTGANQKIANYLADPTEEAILHMVDADPARTPTLAEFAKPDYYLTQGSSTCDDSVTGIDDNSADCVTQNNGFAYDHGDYAAEINTNYVGFAGPGVQHLGLDGSAAADGPNSAGANSGQTEVIDTHLKGPWTDETDIEPTEMYLLSLHTDYTQDGRVITQILANPNQALSNPEVTRLGGCYKQLNSSVGRFGAYTLAASTSAIESATPGDAEFAHVNAALSGLEAVRDRLAITIKDELYAAENWGVPVHNADQQISQCQRIIASAQALSAITSSS